MRRSILTAHINVTQDRCPGNVFLNKVPDCNAVRQRVTVEVTLVISPEPPASQVSLGRFTTNAHLDAITLFLVVRTRWFLCRSVEWVRRCVRVRRDAECDSSKRPSRSGVGYFSSTVLWGRDRTRANHYACAETRHVDVGAAGLVLVQLGWCWCGCRDQANNPFWEAQTILGGSKFGPPSCPHSRCVCLKAMKFS